MSDDALVPRLCHLVKWPDFNGFGFNLHAERGKAGQYIGKVDEGSPAEAAGLKPKDRIVEVNGSNIGNENHQQVVMRIRAGGDETKLLVVDAETDAKYKELKVVIRADLPEVVYTRADPPASQSTGNGEVVEAAPEPEPEITPASNEVVESAPSDQMSYRPRYCHMRKWDDFDGYGFNLHAEKDKPGQYIGKIDEGSPAEAARLREGDRIVEVNDENIEDSTHQQVIGKIKAGGSETRLLVVDKDVDDYYKSHSIKVHHDMPQIDRYTTPLTSGKGTEEPEIQTAAVAVEASQSVEVEVEQGGLASGQDLQEADTEPEPLPPVPAEAEPEAEASLVASEAGVVAAAFDAAAADDDDDVAGQADEGTAEAEEQQQPPTYQEQQEEEKEVVEEKVEAEQNVEAEAEPEPEAARPQEDQEVVVAEAAPSQEAAPEEAPEEPAEPESPAAPEAVNGEDEPAAEQQAAEPVPDKPEENGAQDSVQEQPQATVITVRASEPEEAPVSQKPVNGQQTVIAKSEPAPAPEPERPANVANGGDPMAMSAKEMRERLAAKKRSDPRNQKMDFRTKHQMFEKM